MFPFFHISLLAFCVPRDFWLFIFLQSFPFKTSLQLYIFFLSLGDFYYKNINISTSIVYHSFKYSTLSAFLMHPGFGWLSSSLIQIFCHRVSFVPLRDLNLIYTFCRWYWYFCGFTGKEEEKVISFYILAHFSVLDIYIVSSF